MMQESIELYVVRTYTLKSPNVVKDIHFSGEGENIALHTGARTVRVSDLNRQTVEEKRQKHKMSCVTTTPEGKYFLNRTFGYEDLLLGDQ